MRIDSIFFAALWVALASGCASRPPAVDPAEMETRMDAWEQKIRSGELEQTS